MRILLTGASGFIGTYLKRYFQKQNYEVVPFRRKDPSFFSVYPMQQFDLVLNLAGEPLFSFWTQRKKKRILESRVLGTKRLVEAMEKNPPKRFFSASAIGFYGSQEKATEKTSQGKGFLSQVCGLWEKEAQKAEKLSVPVTLLRFGVVLGRGGFLAKMIFWTKLGLSAVLGSGEQFISWIAIEDLANALSFLLDHPEITGPVNLVSIKPIQQKKFSQKLALHVSKPCFLKIPAFLLKLGLSSLAKELLLVNQTVFPEKLKKAGFVFVYTDIETVLEKYYPR